MRYSHLSIKPARPLALALATALILSACSSGSDSAATDGNDGASTATSEPAPAGSDSDEPVTTDGPTDDQYDCEALAEYSLVLRTANGWLPQVMAEESPEMIDALGGDLDEIDAAIEGLRPIQDIDNLFGPPREGLDNMASDVAAIRAETYGETAGPYNVASITAVLGEDICQ